MTSPKKQRPGGQGGEVLIHLEKYGKSWSGAWGQRASQTTAKWSEFKQHQQEDKGIDTRKEISSVEVRRSKNTILQRDL